MTSLISTADLRLGWSLGKRGGRPIFRYKRVEIPINASQSTQEINQCQSFYISSIVISQALFSTASELLAVQVHVLKMLPSFDGLHRLAFIN